MEIEGQFEEIRPAQEGAAREPIRRAKSSLRLKYEAETHVIERKLGDLESIRARLGLSQRKMAQLLLVDPSAWTRWTKGADKAPPHIFRMLQWYLALEEKYPALDVNFWLNTVAQIPDPNSKTLALATQMSARANELEADFGEKLERTKEELAEAHFKIRVLENSQRALSQQTGFSSSVQTSANLKPSIKRTASWTRLLSLMLAFGIGVLVAVVIFKLAS